VSGRIRTLKPEWLEDELIASEPDAVRILTVGLILLADDHGCGRAATNFIASEVWKYDRSPEVLTKVRESLLRLSTLRFIRLYEVDGQSYFEIRSWAKHQRVQHVGVRRVPEPLAETATKSATRTVPRKSRETLAKVPEVLTKVPESLTPDHRSPITAEGSPITAEGTLAPPPAPSPAKAYRAPTSVDPGAPAWLEREGIPSLASESGTDVAEFLDYWSAVGGAKGCKLSWAGTWRNNVKMRAGRKPSAGRAPWLRPVQPMGPSQSQTLAEFYADKADDPSGAPL